MTDQPIPTSSRCRLLITLAVVSLAPATAFAHERWFVPKDEQPPTDWGALFSLPVLLALIGGTATVLALAWLQRNIGDPLWPRPPFFQRLEPAAPAILGV